MRRVAILLLAVGWACGGSGAGGGASDASTSQQIHPDAGVPPDGGPDGSVADAGHPDAEDPDADAGPLPLRRSPIADENQLPGSGGWGLNAPSDSIAAYVERTSALPGETIAIHAGAATATTASWELWRLGYYGGAGGRKVAEGGGGVAIPVWAPATLDPLTGAVAAGWPAAFRLRVPDNAVTGAYLVKISSPLGQTYATFVVREPARAAVILYPMSTNTYQAYNAWGGTSLYDNFRTDWSRWHAFAVSFDRPYLQDHGAGELLSKDRDFINFAEAQGLDIAYVTDTDLDANPGLVLRRRMLLFQGHSEYWTAAMREAGEKAVAAGTNLAFLAANNCYWQVRFADGSRRTLIGYKEFANLDPAGVGDPAHLTTRWRDPPLNQPESQLIGELYGAWQWVAAPLSVRDPSSWLWKGAGVAADTVIAGVYSDEVDNRGDSRMPHGVAVVASAMTEDHNGTLAAGESTLYTAASGAQVFSTGTIQWSVALASAGKWDARIQQATANLFSAFAGDGTLPARMKPMGLPAGAPKPVYRPGVRVTTVARGLHAPSAVAVAANGDALVVDDQQILRVTPAGGVTVVAGSRPGFADGPGQMALFSDPRGIAVGPDGTIYVADTRNNRIRAIAGGMVRTIAGATQGFTDGIDSQAQFTWPMGIAWIPSPTLPPPGTLASGTLASGPLTSGTLLVADTWNHRLREVKADGTVSTWAGTGLLGLQDGPGATATLRFPMFLSPMPGGDGSAVFVEPESGVLRKVSAGPTHDVSKVVGSIGAMGWNDGLASDAMLSETIAAAVMADGSVVFLDGATARVRALRNGVVDTLAGGTKGGTVDGAGPDAGFGFPRALAVAPDGSILVADVAEGTLRRITMAP